MQIQQDQANQRHQMAALVQAQLDAFQDWDKDTPTIAVNGETLTVTVTLEGTTFSVDGVVHSYVATASWQGEIVPGARATRSVTVAWNNAQLVTLGQEAYRLSGPEPVCWITTERSRSSINCHPLRVNPAWGQFVEWALRPNKVLALIRVGIPGFPSQIFEIEVGELKNGTIVWQKFGPVPNHYLTSLVPEVPAEAQSHLEAARAAYQEAGQTAQMAGLRSVPDAVFYELRRLGVAGSGWNGWAAGSNHGVIHPDVLPLFDGAQHWGAPTDAFENAVMRSDAPANAWESIEWPHGPKPDAEQIARIRADTVEDIRPLRSDELDAWFRQLPGELEAEIIAIETPGEPHAYRFNAVVQLPHHVVVKLASNLGFAQVLIRQGDELRPHTITDIARGNQHFAGSSTVSVEYVKIRGNYRWVYRWEAPQTAAEETAEKVAAIRDLIRRAKDDGLILSGWRYTDTGNPIVLVGGAEGWILTEFDRTTYTTSRRKGSGSRKGDIYTTGTPDHRQIETALTAYRDYGWEVAADQDWREKAGKSILSIFPPALLAKIEGGQ
ncbi:hypothetical protein HGA91_02055 [candidate division WWE3 bacterium]|nr:hypothetical protein [candidate division WWE3 bacterium]